MKNYKRMYIYIYIYICIVHIAYIAICIEILDKANHEI